MSEKNPQALEAKAAAAGVSLDDVKAGLRRLLPIIKPIAKLTPNKVDDAAVLFLEALLAE